MLKKPNKIDVIYRTDSQPQSPMAIFVETGEWEDPKAIENLKKKLLHYQSQITSGALNAEPEYKDRTFPFFRDDFQEGPI